MNTQEIITLAENWRNAGTNASAAERDLMKMVASLARVVHDQQGVIADLVRNQLRMEGIDMNPTYERLRAIVAKHRAAGGEKREGEG